MDVIFWILNRIKDFWDMLISVQLPYGFNFAQLFIGLLILDIIAEFFGVGLFGGHKEIK